MDHKLGGIPVNAGEIELSLLKKRNEYQNLKKDLSWGGSLTIKSSVDK